MLVIFDCDGVLVDSEILASRVDSERLSAIGYDISIEEMSHRFAGLTWDRIAKLIEADMGRSLPENFHTETDKELDRRLGTELNIIPGVQEMLDRLDYPRCICSNSSPERLRISLTHTKLYDRFRPYVFSAVAVRDKRPKPAPDVFLHGAAEFDVDPRQCVVIEDSTHGIHGAKAAGMRVVGFTGGSHSWPGHADALTAAGAETVINRMSDLPAVIEALAAWDGVDI
ncbi:HAD family phosphatase [Kaistia dalseonensis]|uniref:HAD superfamily hydrolase (TIGR01509 family) n=1 Tax=Kaistia dalseonensis TaxID=410840 RepID=A0ABU0HCQ6_9HYPH|nr:HAD family phosphatase [Kaistia dalseonensis]MCX5497464.1 HAD family phosphatase [Kaistia dalseonensis]MDQ0440103.1 HAD superfamily hydrolase (TIGR01509 family) [Kaistia dalseonensis]